MKIIKSDKSIFKDWKLEIDINADKIKRAIVGFGCSDDGSRRQPQKTSKRGKTKFDVILAQEGLTKREVCNMINRSQAALNSYFSGTQKMPDHIAEILAERFKTTKEFWKWE